MFKKNKIRKSPHLVFEVITEAEPRTEGEVEPRSNKAEDIRLKNGDFTDFIDFTKSCSQRE